MHNKKNGLHTIIIERDSYTCVLCTRPATDIHHVVKRSHGGSNHPHNLVALCRIHHDLVHGVRWHGVELTTEEARQTIIEYIQDYYACERQSGNIHDYDQDLEAGLKVSYAIDCNREDGG